MYHKLTRNFKRVVRFGRKRIEVFNSFWKWSILLFCPSGTLKDVGYEVHTAKHPNILMACEISNVWMWVAYALAKEYIFLTGWLDVQASPLPCSSKTIVISQNELCNSLPIPMYVGLLTGSMRSLPDFLVATGQVLPIWCRQSPIIPIKLMIAHLLLFAV